MRLNELGTIMVVSGIFMALSIAVAARYFNDGKDSEIEEFAEEVAEDLIKFEFQEIMDAVES